MAKDWVQTLENVNQVKLSGRLAEVVERKEPDGRQVLFCNLLCEKFSVLLAVRNAPAEIRDKVFQSGNAISITGRLGHGSGNFFIDVQQAEVTPLHDEQAKRIAARARGLRQWSCIGENVA